MVGRYLRGLLHVLVSCHCDSYLFNLVLFQEKRLVKQYKEFLNQSIYQKSI